MKITFLGQAGLFIETKYGSILCDPWFHPAYFASWFPFPSNEQIDRQKISNPTYLYVSHLHHDHYDPQFLREVVNKNTIVLLPDYPMNHLEQALRGLGFQHFIQTKNCTPFEQDGLRMMIYALTAPTDGPIGDSGLMVDDGESRIFNQNDSRPVDMDLLASHGPYDALFLQFSGAIWYPMVYKFPQAMKDTLSRKKRENQMARALKYITEIDAKYVVPSAGPPCFLDDDLFDLNDFHRSDTNIFPDQTVFLEYMRDHGVNSGRLMLPDSVMTLENGECRVEHPVSDAEVDAIFTDKESYLKAYQARQRSAIEAERASWPHGEVDVLPRLKEWFEPLMRQADVTAAGINGLIILDLGSEKICLDFHKRTVEAWDGGEWDYIFEIEHGLVEKCILNHYDDWVNELFLSCRFRAQRKGAYNEHIYNFFKCLSQERIQYLEGYLAEKAPVQDLWQCDGYLVQRRCPHLKADLTRFGHVEDGILTCRMHGWQFDLETGRCLTSDDRHLFTRKIEGKQGEDQQSESSEQKQR